MVGLCLNLYLTVKWIDTEEIELFNYHQESETGIILEVDLTLKSYMTSIMTILVLLK